MLTADKVARSECLPEEAVEAPCVTGCALNLLHAVLGCARTIPCTRPAQYTPGQDPHALLRCTALATPLPVHAPASHDSSAVNHSGIQAQCSHHDRKPPKMSCCLAFGSAASPAQCMRLKDMTAPEVPLMGALCGTCSGHACTPVIFGF